MFIVEAYYPYTPCWLDSIFYLIKIDSKSQGCGDGTSPRMNFELKKVKGIPHYVSGTTAYTFEVDGGVASEHCVAIGTYSADTDQIEYYPDWRERVEPRLVAFRASLVSHARDALRDAVVKPQKPRKAARNPRKSSNRTKNLPGV